MQISFLMSTLPGLMRPLLKIDCFTIVIAAGLIAMSPANAASEVDDENPAQQAVSKNAEADLAYGAYQRGMYLTAFKLALPRANKGDAAAQTLIAELYEKGLGVGRDTKEAAAWYEIAAQSGNREAQFSFAVKLLSGIDVPQDQERGREMMKAAADAGHSVAMFNEAHRIIQERPTSAGYRLALPLFEKSAEMGVGDAFYSLSRIYGQGLATGIQDPEKARYWLIRAARTGFDTAQVELAISLANGTDGPKDVELAVSWFKIAANGGNVIAQNRLAHLLVQGFGDERSPVEAAKWHILARRAGRIDIVLDKFLIGLDKDTRAKALQLANRWPIYK